MTQAQAKQELLSYRHLQVLARQKQEDVWAMKARVYGGVHRLRPVPGKGNSMPGDRGLSTLVELAEAQEELLLEAERTRLAVEKRIGLLSAPSSTILYDFYIRGFSLVKVARLLGYEYTWTCKLHARGVREYAAAFLQPVQMPRSGLSLSLGR